MKSTAAIASRQFFPRSPRRSEQPSLSQNPRKLKVRTVSPADEGGDELQPALLCGPVAEAVGEDHADVAGSPEPPDQVNAVRGGESNRAVARAP